MGTWHCWTLRKRRKVNKVFIVGNKLYFQADRRRNIRQTTYFRVDHTFREEQIINRYGVPTYTVADNGSNFIKPKMTQLIDKYGFEHKILADRYVRENEQVERSNRTVEVIKKRVFPNGNKWLSEFEDILLAYKTTRKEQIGQSLLFMVYGLDPILPIEFRIPTLRVAKADVTTSDWNILDHNIFLDEWRNKGLMRLEACTRR